MQDKQLPTGFTVIKREVFHQLMAACSEMQYTDDSVYEVLNQSTEPFYCPLLDCKKDEKRGHYLCDSSGITPFVDSSINLHHTRM